MEFFQNVLYSGIFFIFLGFLSGSVPYGFVYSYLRGVDIRTIGSGNIGATNVTRQFGFWQGFIPVAFLDILKGVVPVVLFRVLVVRDNDPLLFDTMEIFIGIAAILGHVFSPFLGFKGGKGVGTTVGVLLAWNYVVALFCLSVFGVTFFTFGKRIVGRGSIVMAILFPFITIYTPSTTIPLKITSVFLALLILWTHRNNIKDWISKEDIKKQQTARETKKATKELKKQNKG